MDHLGMTFHYLQFYEPRLKMAEWFELSFALIVQLSFHIHHAMHDRKMHGSNRTSKEEFLALHWLKIRLLLFVVQVQIFHLHFLRKYGSRLQNKSWLQ